MRVCVYKLYMQCTSLSHSKKSVGKDLNSAFYRKECSLPRETR